MKIKIDKNHIYECIRKVYDPYYECYLYYTREFDEPFCDLDADFEVIIDDV